MKVTARILSALAIMVFMAIPAIASAEALANEAAVEVVADAPEGEAKEKKECAEKKECTKEKKECCKEEKKCCAEKKEKPAEEKKAE